MEEEVEGRGAEKKDLKLQMLYMVLVIVGWEVAALVPRCQKPHHHHSSCCLSMARLTQAVAPPLPLASAELDG